MSLLCNALTTAAGIAAYTHGGVIYTFAAWVFPTSLGEGGLGGILEHGPQYTQHRVTIFCSNTPNVNCFRTRHGHSVTVGEYATPANSLVLNVWQHVAMTVDRSATANIPIIYLNGVAQPLTTINTAAGTFSPDGLGLAVGSELAAGSGSNTFAGNIGEAAVWNRILSAAEIAAVYALGVFAVPNGLMLYWPLDNAAALDHSGNGRHGTVTAGALGLNPPTRPAGRLG